MKCPICKKPADPAYRPFCSRRCADVDLARWFREDYAIPVPLTEEDDDPSDPVGKDDQA
ncbi:DNA gyrase inhibitor YacG [Roseinatronobacter bogoriensis]|uniref:DNA gyrase inhibitor YacG n=1 Tax=Roseinatronobacter bogoriensis subsp. barguzinensis TaxID=441209 RepID=A0A2K8KAF6_9RHOB|nr:MULTISPECIES: DNA gyrase inhibitor YacG [Rhodobaca]ATX66427.1 DNA gyrase inhibitor YacG [Rhodobaca barguzinensis]